MRVGIEEGFEYSNDKVLIRDIYGCRQTYIKRKGKIIRKIHKKRDNYKQTKEKKTY